MQLSDLIALASILRPMGGPQIPALAKAPNNVTGLPMGRAALNAPEMSSPAQMLGAMSAASLVPSELALKQAQSGVLQRQADFLKQVDLSSLMGGAAPMSGSGGAGMPGGTGMPSVAVQPAPASTGGSDAAGSNPFGLPPGPLPKLADAFWKIESGRSLDGNLTSKADALGPMQIMPSTGAQYGAADEVLRDAGTNLKVGGAIIGDLASKYGMDPEAIAVAYNAGPGRADKWLAAGRDPSVLPAETRNYLTQLNRELARGSSYGFTAPGGVGGGDAMAGGQTQPPPLSVAPGAGAVNVDPAALARNRLLLALGGVSGDPLQGFAQAYYQSPQYLAAAEAAKRWAGVAPDLYKDWNSPGASAALQAQIAGAKTVAEKQAALQAAGVDPGSPQGQAILGAGAANAAGIKPFMGGEQPGTPLMKYNPATGGYDLAQPPDYAVAAAGLAGAKTAGERSVTESSDIRINQAKEGFVQVPKPGGGYVLEPITGSATEQAARGQQAQKGITSDIVARTVDDALGLSSNFTTGMLGNVSKYVPGMPGYDLARKLDTLRANAGFAQLQAMRSSSPTGGALGPVSDTENRLLQSTITSLDQAQSKDQFESALKDFKRTFLDITLGTPEQLTNALAAGRLTKQEFDAAIKRRESAIAGGASSAQAPPSVGEVRDGYKFLGGDPANQKSWAKMP